ncbi:hypothetical protein EX30DRAFT_350672 [Ascodesmis nigricans]|uniref:Retrotransposon gag domain-containing protein n=1 Tax=Ascodesmis nigricans TaxID=341454 RepID=A0A4S2MP53_9PEZI|nr:hypothetical protein EX30DRAFT_350672 [Ascodesmis nigricans]
MAEMNKQVMPQPSTAGASSFNGSNVTKFLQNFERIEVRLLKGYAENNWQVFRESMETRYVHRDPEQAKFTITYLRTAAEGHYQGKLTMRDYYTRYAVAAGKMERKGLMTDRELVTLFISGLGKEQQIEAVRRTQLNIGNPSSLKWDSMVYVIEK